MRTNPVQFAACALLTILKLPTVRASANVITCTLSIPAQQFSGTGCGIGWSAGTSGSVYVGPPQYWRTRYIVSVVLTINGETAANVSYPNLQNVHGGVTVDSTHFSDGVIVTIGAAVTTNLGEVETFDATRPIYNKGYVLLDSTLGADNADCAAEVALDLQQQAKHTVLASSTDPKETILGILEYYTVFWILTHGGSGEFGDCNTDGTVPGNELTHYLFSSDVSSYVGLKWSGIPVYCFVHIYACSTFATSAMANAFGISNTSVNRAAIGWPVEMAYGDANNQWSDDLWGCMTAAGETLDQAIQDATFNSPNHGACYTALRASQLPYPQLYGDAAMKLHGVYGSSGPDQWHSP